MNKISRFIIKYADLLDWEKASRKVDINNVDKSVINEFVYKWHWDRISAFQELSDAFIDQYGDWIDWVIVCSHQKLSEGLINKHVADVDWQMIFTYQDVSDEFLFENRNKIIWMDSFNRAYLFNERTDLLERYILTLQKWGYGVEIP